MTPHPSRVTSRRRKALGMVEAVVSTLIVGVMLVAALKTVSASKIGLQKTGERGRGAMLVQQLMAEILQCPYADPDNLLGLIGLDASELGGARAGFDDVDDYHNWSESPPQDYAGVVIPDLVDWERSVAVEYVNPADLTQTVGADSGVKRITVTATFRGRVAASWVGIRTSTGAPGVLVNFQLQIG